MYWPLRYSALATVTLLVGSRATAVPPPPPPDYIDELAQRLLPLPASGTFGRYAAAFSSDLVVRENGDAKFTSKDAWLDAERHKIGKVDRIVLTYAEDYTSVLIVDRFDDRSDVPSSPDLAFDARYSTRSMRYFVGTDHLVHSIDIVQTAGFPRVPK